ncbi:MAG: SET domain-containing protein-lysine N-methyltransferase, partial [Limisphaerales bacterium]
GGFAARDVPSGSRLIEYLGERISKVESHRRCEVNNPFIFHLDDETDLDGNVDWNPARWLNHSCEPNCEAECDGGRIWINSARDIKAGEELTFNYSYDLADYRDFPCRCGTPACVGFMVAEEFFAVVRMENPARA